MVPLTLQASCGLGPDLAFTFILPKMGSVREQLLANHPPPPSPELC